MWIRWILGNEKRNTASIFKTSYLKESWGILFLETDCLEELKWCWIDGFRYRFHARSVATPINSTTRWRSANWANRCQPFLGWSTSTSSWHHTTSSPKTSASSSTYPITSANSSLSSKKLRKGYSSLLKLFGYEMEGRFETRFVVDIADLENLFIFYSIYYWMKW